MLNANSGGVKGHGGGLGGRGEIDRDETAEMKKAKLMLLYSRL